MKTATAALSEKVKQFYLGDDGALEQLHTLDHYIAEKARGFLGYPCNSAFNLEKFIEWWDHSSLSKNALNDVGDPQSVTPYALNAHSYERVVVDFFAELFNVAKPWGYVTSGGTQGNEQGLYIGRQFLKAKYGTPILYFSEEAHYSVKTLGKVLGLECRSIETGPTGQMDYADLEKKLNPKHPALFSISIGTTFKGAIDDIEVISALLKAKKIPAYYHADAALFGGYLPFHSDPLAPDLNFERYPYDSIAVSGHKFFGSPIPMGFFLVRNDYINSLKSEYIEYIDTYNLTIPCSRSSLNTLLFWWRISTTPITEFVSEVTLLMENSAYFLQQLKERHYPVWLNPFSNTLFFRTPPPSICKEWSLSRMTCHYLGRLAHAVIMQHVTREMIDRFLEEFDLAFVRSASKE